MTHSCAQGILKLSETLLDGCRTRIVTPPCKPFALFSLLELYLSWRRLQSDCMGANYHLKRIRRGIPYLRGDVNRQPEFCLQRHFELRPFYQR